MFYWCLLLEVLHCYLYHVIFVSFRVLRSEVYLFVLSLTYCVTRNAILRLFDVYAAFERNQSVRVACRMTDSST
jgi:hypothetical protein